MNDENEKDTLVPTPFNQFTCILVTHSHIFKHILFYVITNPLPPHPHTLTPR